MSIVDPSLIPPCLTSYKRGRERVREGWEWPGREGGRERGEGGIIKEKNNSLFPPPCLSLHVREEDRGQGEPERGRECRDGQGGKGGKRRTENDLESEDIKGEWGRARGWFRNALPTYILTYLYLFAYLPVTLCNYHIFFTTICLSASLWYISFVI